MSPNIPETPDFTGLAALNKAAGEPLRLEILRVLAQDSYGVLELCEIFQHKQSGMSHHLKVLADASLVAKRREGNSIFYSRALPGATSAVVLSQQLFATIDTISVSADIAERLQQVKQERAKQSQQFFVQQADKFKAQQDLIAEYPVYGAAVTELLIKTRPPANDLAVEVGPGAGEFLPVLAEQFKQVVALDNAPTMLQKAEEHCVQYYSQDHLSENSKNIIENIQFVNGDTQKLSVNNIEADCIVMNMVLHHTASPATIFADVANSLKTDGVLLVTDLCRHDQDWARSACGDLWLGFDASELESWASFSGLEKGQSNYLALRNGFQIQLQQFRKI